MPNVKKTTAATKAAMVFFYMLYSKIWYMGAPSH